MSFQNLILYGLIVPASIITAFIIIVRIFYPDIFRRYVVPNFEGSYDPVEDHIDHVDRDEKLSTQEGIPILHHDFGNFSYTIGFGKGRDLLNGHVRVHVQGTWYSSHPKDAEVLLEFAGLVVDQMETRLGKASVLSARWHIPNTTTEIETRIFQYPGQDFLVFQAEFHAGIEGIQTGNYNEPSIVFPSFENASPNRRVLCFKNQVFSPAQRHFAFVTSPVLMFDDDRNAFLLSALDNFITNGIQKESISPSLERINCGPNGLVQRLPAGHSHAYILVFHHGINQAFTRWGDLLRTYYATSTRDRYIDLMNSRLGYFTDNGAYYYYRPIKRKFDTTLLAIKQYADKENLPFSYYGLDSWWYEKSVKTWKRALVNFLRIRLGGGLYGGALKWEPDPYYFDLSLAELSKRMGGARFTAHHRWYMAETPYKERFQFILENGWAMSIDPAYWEYIMDYAEKNSIILYEQDWMISHSNHFHAFKTDVGFGETWLREMATAAARHRLTIQYCMATPSMWMASVKHGNVTNVRGSNDYHADWPHVYDMSFFTQSSILARALNLWPFKDVFFTTKRGFMWGERCPELEAILSALSAGPVALGDPIGHVDKKIVHACCRPDGMLLKPDRPITAVDAMFTRHAKYYICSTESKQVGNTWHYVLVANLWPKRIQDRGYTLNELDIHGNFVEYEFGTREARLVDSNERIELALQYEHYSLRVYAPVFESGYALLGDAGRYAMMNDKTFSGVKAVDGGFEATITGIAGDVVEIAIFCPKPPSSVTLDGIRFPDSLLTLGNAKNMLYLPIRFESDGSRIMMVWGG
nr:hypothetical protein [Candidatus Sigynarchaeota archaeon]